MVRKYTSSSSNNIVGKKKSKIEPEKNGTSKLSDLELTRLKDARLRRLYENKEIRIDKFDEFGLPMSIRRSIG